MLHLPDVTLFCADCVDAPRAVAALDKCTVGCTFGAIKFLTSLPTDYPHRVEIAPITDHTMYSIFMVKEAHKYIDTSHMLCVQHDGWILHPEVWDPQWLQYDYVAPLFNQYNIVGSGGFSLRSRALMAEISRCAGPWDGTLEGAKKLQDGLGCYEDGSCSEFSTRPGFRRAPPEEAAKFAQCGNFDPQFRVRLPFGFHRWTNVTADDAASLS